MSFCSSARTLGDAAAVAAMAFEALVDRVLSVAEATPPRPALNVAAVATAAVSVVILLNVKVFPPSKPADGGQLAAPAMPRKVNSASRGAERVNQRTRSECNDLERLPS
ncbi:hypothetical protein [Streptomyces violascens]|uniref:hypothetical protein n=1 Tax=Streptomyces violascens TaxID=67381 RepID=UPI00369CEA71